MLRILMLSFFALLLTGCSNEVKDDFFAMDTYMTSVVYGTQEDSDAVKSEIYRLDSLLRWDKIDVSQSEVSELIIEAEELKIFTGGAFDISVSPILELWGFRDKKFRVPYDSEILEALSLENTSVDFGGIGKGYAGKKVRELLLSRGVTSAIVSLGGNVQTVGTKPDGKPWRVGIQNPDGDGYIGYTDVSDLAVVTSGGYHRYFEADGKKYSHIINPQTGYPADTDIKSVTVVSQDGTAADALSTAFYVLGTHKTKELCERENYLYKNVPFGVIIIDDENEIHCMGEINFERKN